MSKVLVSCEGIHLPPFLLASFELNQGELLCLHLPFGDTVEDRLIPGLTGKSPIPGLHFFCKVEHAYLPQSRTGFSRFFEKNHPIQWLCRNASLSIDQAEEIAARLNLEKNLPLELQPQNARTLLGLEAAWARGAQVVVFDTSGCDPIGMDQVFEVVFAHQEKGAAIRLNHGFTQNGRFQHGCFPGSICLEIQQTLPQAISSTLQN